MTEYLNSIPVLDDLSNLVKWLLLVNVLLTGTTILFAFRAALYKERVEELEQEIAKSVNDALVLRYRMTAPYLQHANAGRPSN